MTERQAAAAQSFRTRDVSPYFSRSKETPTENRLREIAQNIKRQAADKEAGRQTKTDTAKTSMASDSWRRSPSGGDADDDAGYQTANMDQ